MTTNKTLIIDNGGDTCKIGIAGVDKQPRIIPNMVCKSKGTAFIADQIETDCQDYSGLSYKRPFDRGYLVDCELQFMIWNHIFNHTLDHNIQPSDTTLFLSRQPFTPTTIQVDVEQLVFEHFAFDKFCSLSCAYLNFYNSFKEQQKQEPPGPIAQTGTALIVDTGFSFTHIIPVVNHKIYPRGIKRIDIGGKALTNYMKEVVSLRYYDMRDETYLMNIVKERMCLTSLDFISGLNDTEFSQKLQQVYVLPDYQTSMTGEVRSNTAPVNSTGSREEQTTLTLNNERIAVPELLFHPSDTGMEQSGIPETIRNSIASIDNEVIQSVLYDTIVLVGGNTKFKNFGKRVQREVRQLAPSHFNVSVHSASEPITNCWHGASKYATMESDQVKNQYTVTKNEYQEYGHNICLRKFIL